MNVDVNLLRSDLIRDEGEKLYVYDDATGLPIVPGYTCKGHPTIGVGRALDVNGITQEESDYLLMNSENKVIQEVGSSIPWVTSLSEPRQRVLVEMAYNMGIDNLLEFHDTLRYIQEGRFQLAAKSMLSSVWARQVGKRADRLADMMRNG